MSLQWALLVSETMVLYYQGEYGARQQGGETAGKEKKAERQGQSSDDGKGLDIKLLRSIRAGSCVPEETKHDVFELFRFARIPINVAGLVLEHTLASMSDVTSECCTWDPL